MRKKILFTGGGTGGHVYPALAIIEKLDDKDLEILWLGSSNGMERQIIKKQGISYYGIPSGKLRRYFSFRNFFDIFKIIGGFIASFLILLKLRPSLIFSKGGFVTVPPVAAASLLRIPVFTHESDIGPGLATRINSVSAKRILVSSEKSINYFKKAKRDKVFVTGNPIRSDITSGSVEQGKRIIGGKIDKPVILVLGGSLGAAQLNNLILDNLKELTEKYFIIHQTGEKNLSTVKHNNYFPAAYINEELPHLLAITDLVISRAGASVVWEYAAVSLPSILIPLESGSRGEQVENAKLFSDLGTSRVLRGDITSESLLNLIAEIFDDDKILSKMKEAAKNIKIPDSASIISDMILEAVKQK